MRASLLLLLLAAGCDGDPQPEPADPPVCECDAAITKSAIGDFGQGGVGLYAVTIAWGGAPGCAEPGQRLGFTDPLPPGVTVTQVGTGWICGQTPTDLHCDVDLDPLPDATDSYTLLFSVDIAPGTTEVTNCAELVLDADHASDTNPDNNASCVTTPLPCGGWTDPILVTTESTDPNRLVVYTSNGDGTFAGPTLVADNLGGTYAGPVVADFDEDGDYEILAEQDNVLYRVDWDACLETAMATPVQDIRVAPQGGGDFDGDGDVDLFGWSGSWSTASWTGQMVGFTYLNDGQGQFSAIANAFDLSAPYAYGGHAAYHADDVDGDGCEDLVVTSYVGMDDDASAVWRYPGQCDGTFGAPVHDQDLLVSGSAGQPTNSSDLMDLDGNGYPDLVLGLDDDGDPGSVWRVLSAGDLSAPAVEWVDVSGTEYDNTGCCSGALRLYDYTGDDLVDLVVKRYTDATGSADPQLDLHFGTVGAGLDPTPLPVAAVDAALDQAVLAVPIDR